VHGLATFITDFGDSAVTMPLAALTMLLLIVLRRPRLALDWAACIAVCLGAIAAVKLLLAGCSHRIAVPCVASPSGHAALGAVVYGGFALLLAGPLGPVERRAVYTAAALLILAIAGSRVVLQVHSLAETALGLGAGLAAVAAFRAVLAAGPPVRLPVAWLCGGALLSIVVMHGTRWPTEFAIHGLARSGLFRALLPWCS
jgi:membrane-associated phospholipid phosphatase